MPSRQSAPGEQASPPKGPSKNHAAWASFHQELLAFMDWRGVTPAQLAAQIDTGNGPIDPARVRQWRADNGRPDLDELPHIVEALAMNEASRDEFNEWVSNKRPESPGLAERRAAGVADWTYLVTRMGLVPSSSKKEAVRLATKVATLEGRRQRVSDELAAYSLDLGAAQLVKAVTGNAEWAIAVWPAIEGFTETRADGTVLNARLHVADRVDFRRIDGQPAEKSAVWDAFEDSLKAARAISTTQSSKRWPRAETDTDDSVSSWSIRRLAAPHSSAVEHAYSDLHSVAVTSLTVASWANDVADHIARLIGYGFTSSRDVATDLYGPTDPGAFGESRAELHHELLNGAMSKRVWGHFAASQTGLPELLGDPALKKLFTVYLKEHDADLESEARRLKQWEKDRRKDSFWEPTEPLPPTVEGTVELLKERRRQVDELVADREGSVLVHELQEHRGEGRRKAKYRESFEVATRTVRHWIASGRVPEVALKNYWDKVRRKANAAPTAGLTHALMLIEFFEYEEEGRSTAL